MHNINNILMCPEWNADLDENLKCVECNKRYSLN